MLLQCMSAEMKLKVLQERMAGRKDTASELKKRESEFLSLVHINVSNPVQDLSSCSITQPLFLDFLGYRLMCMHACMC